MGTFKMLQKQELLAQVEQAVAAYLTNRSADNGGPQGIAEMVTNWQQAGL